MGVLGMQSDPSASQFGPEPRDEDPSLESDQSLVFPVPAMEPDVEVWPDLEAFPTDGRDRRPGRRSSRTARQNPGSQTYSLRTTLRFTFITKKFGRTGPPIDMFPMEDSWPVYGLNVLQATPKSGHYGPGAAFAARANNVYLPFSGAHLIDATGEPRDNPLQQFSVWAIGGFDGGQQFATAAKSAIRGGS